MKNWLQPVAFAVIGIGFLTSASIADAADPVKTRQAVMKEISTHVKAIGAYLKGHKDPKKAARLGTPGDIELRAMAVASLAKRLPSFFPKGTSLSDMPGKTRAKPDIWAQNDKFMAAAATLETMANKVAEAAATGEKSKIAAAMKGLGKTACGGCHSTFRGPKPKKSM